MPCYVLSDFTLDFPLDSAFLCDWTPILLSQCLGIGTMCRAGIGCCLVWPLLLSPTTACHLSSVTRGRFACDVTPLCSLYKHLYITPIIICMTLVLFYILVATFSAIGKEESFVHQPSGDGEAIFPRTAVFLLWHKAISELQLSHCSGTMYTHMSYAPLLSKVCSMQYIVEAVISRLNDIWYVAKKLMSYGHTHFRSPAHLTIACF